MDKASLTASLQQYQTPYPEEAAFIPRFLELLDDQANPYLRSRVAGHLTASAWITTPAHDAALLILHRKLNRWLQPGGHADGDQNLAAVAAKEVSEETGLQAVGPAQGGIFDIDIHKIPANSRDAAHEHYDIRFRFEVPSDAYLQINHEVKEIAWKPLSWILNTYQQEPSIYRMALKTQLL